jgi:transporter family protein
MWIIYVLLSAFFAAITNIFAKIGMENVNSTLATAIRSVVILLISWLFVFLVGKQNEIMSLSQKNWIFLLLSGIAAGLSWLCYFKALQIGQVSKVIPLDKMSIVFGILFAALILKETIDLKVIIGGVFIVIGSVILLL